MTTLNFNKTNVSVTSDFFKVIILLFYLQEIYMKLYYNIEHLHVNVPYSDRYRQRKSN